MSETSTTQEVIAEVLAVSQPTVCNLLRDGLITSLARLETMAEHPATRDCVLAFTRRLHTRLDVDGIDSLTHAARFTALAESTTSLLATYARAYADGTVDAGENEEVCEAIRALLVVAGPALVTLEQQRRQVG